MDVKGRSRSDNIEDRSVFPADPRGPSSTLPDSLLQIAIRQIADRVKNARASSGMDLNGTIAGYAHMLSHGALSPEAMDSFGKALNPQDGAGGPGPFEVLKALLSMSDVGSREMGTDVRNGYAAALMRLAAFGKNTGVDVPYITRMRAMLGKDPSANYYLQRSPALAALSRDLGKPLSANSGFGPVNLPVSWGLESAPYAGVPLGDESSVKVPNYVLQMQRNRPLDYEK